jgi:hypothetical protein
MASRKMGNHRGLSLRLVAACRSVVSVSFVAGKILKLKEGRGGFQTRSYGPEGQDSRLQGQFMNCPCPVRNSKRISYGEEN